MIKNIIYFFFFPVFLMIISSQVLPTKQVVDHVYSINYIFVNMCLIEKNGKYTAVDAGNNKQNISKEIEKIGIDTKKIVAVLLTHVDSDHVTVIDAFDNAKFMWLKKRDK